MRLRGVHIACGCRVPNIDLYIVCFWGEEGNQGVVSVHGYGVGVCRANVDAVESPMIKHVAAVRNGRDVDRCALGIRVGAGSGVCGASDTVNGDT